MAVYVNDSPSLLRLATGNYMYGFEPRGYYPETSDLDVHVTSGVLTEYVNVPSGSELASRQTLNVSDIATQASVDALQTSVDAKASQASVNAKASQVSVDVKASQASVDALAPKVEVAEVTLAGAGNYNLFQVKGVVKVNSIYGIVEEVVANPTTGVYLNLWDGLAETNITLAVGSAISGFPAGSLLVKDRDAALIIGVSSAATGFVFDTAGLIFVAFIAGQKTADVDTYIRFTVGAGGASGRIRWHIDWEPFSDDGFIIPV